MKHILYLYFLFAVNTLCFSQNQNGIVVEFNVNSAFYNMESLNEYFQDTFNSYNNDSQYLGRLDEKSIEKGIGYSVNINYQVSEFVGIGMFGSTSFSGKEFPLQFVFEPYPGIPDSNIIIDGLNQISVSSYSVGLSTQISLNSLLKFETSSSDVIKKMDVYSRIMGGFSTTKLEDRLTSAGTNLRENEYRSNSFLGKAELGVGYKIGGSFFTTVGLKIGYQYLKTGDVRNFSNSKLTYEKNKSTQNVSLDFSGLYYGIYINFGK